MIKPLRKAVFPVGGLGTRFLPATKAMPKEMLPVVDKPLIQYAFEEAQEAGIEQFIFVTGRNKNIISNHFDHSYELQAILGEKEKKTELRLTKDWLPKAGQVSFTRQQEPLGLGHAVWCARNLVGDEPFAVLLADVIIQSEMACLAQMKEVYDKFGGSVIAVGEVEKKDVSKYGIIEPEGQVKKGQKVIEIKGMVEKPKPENAPSNLAITGRYILEPEIFSYLESSKTGAGGEIQLTDAMARMLKNNDFRALKFAGREFDCGDKAGFLEANIAFALERQDLRQDVKNLLKKYSA